MADTMTLNGWYLIYPAGSAWIAVKMSGGRLSKQIEGSDAATHIAANDHFATVCRAIADGETDKNVSPAIADQVVREWRDGADSSMCVVERIDIGD